MTKPSLNIRFLAQGMMKLAAEQLPQGFFTWPRENQIKWAQDFWDNRTRQDMLDAVAYLTMEEDSVPDCLEVDDQDNYPILAQTTAWKAFCAPGSQELVPLDDSPPADLAGMSGEELDDMVHDLKSAEATDINNRGREAQIAFISGQRG